jgi:hypothetical protein
MYTIRENSDHLCLLDTSRSRNGIIERRTNMTSTTGLDSAAISITTIDRS